jgi:hypothetical protein
MRKKTSIAAHFEEGRVFWSLVGFIVFLIGLYLYFVSASIVNVLMHEEMSLEISKTHSRISELEMKYVKEKDSVTMNLATNMGFVSVSEKHFVERSVAGKGLTIRR